MSSLSLREQEAAAGMMPCAKKVHRLVCGTVRKTQHWLHSKWLYHVGMVGGELAGSGNCQSIFDLLTHGNSFGRLVTYHSGVLVDCCGGVL